MASRNIDTLNQLQARLEKASSREEALGIFADVVCDDAEFCHAPTLPHGGVHRGRESLNEIQRLIGEHWDSKVSIERMWDVPEEDTVILYLSMKWTSHVTGRTERMPAMERIRFRDGKIARAEVMPRDTTAILSTLTEPAS
jgi:hypothetical protein